jgi:hypothetical protein
MTQKEKKKCGKNGGVMAAKRRQTGGESAAAENQLSERGPF